MKMGFIGAGSMGSALISTLASKSGGSDDDLRFFDADGEKSAVLNKNSGIPAAANNRELVRWADIIVIAVKPADVRDVLEDIKGELSVQKLIASVAAGVDTALIEKSAGIDIPVVRAMPNTPALIGLGMTALCAGAFAREEHLGLAEKLFSAVGEVIRIS
jgi:pyrroline-5-carboxylate reductase